MEDPAGGVCSPIVEWVYDGHLPAADALPDSQAHTNGGVQIAIRTPNLVF